MDNAVVLWRPQPNNVYCMDALMLLGQMESQSVDLIATDPPYFAVKDDAWDNQWESSDKFIEWLKLHLAEMRRVLKTNGSLYIFASPQMGARVEVAVSEYFNVLNHITWKKPPYSTKAEMFDKDMMRGYFPASEVIIFAEQYGSDRNASGEAGYHEQYDEAKRKLKYTILADYLMSEFLRAGAERKEIAALFPSKTGNLTGCVSNWLLGYNLPTEEQYQKMRDYLNHKAGGEFLRREYEFLRREYEDLRRPFNITQADPYTDVWTFRTVQAYEGKHPTEKPLDLMKHIVKASSRDGGLVLDPFAGSGTTLDAARQLGRRYIGCDLDLGYVEIARKRLAQPWTPNMFEALEATS